MQTQSDAEKRIANQWNCVAATAWGAAEIIICHVRNGKRKRFDVCVASRQLRVATKAAGHICNHFGIGISVVSILGNDSRKKKNANRK